MITTLRASSLPDSDYDSDSSASTTPATAEYSSLAEVVALCSEADFTAGAVEEEELEEEMQALEAIYPCGDGAVQFARIGDSRTCLIMAQRAENAVTVKCVLPAGYPDTAGVQVTLHSTQGGANSMALQLVEELLALCKGEWEGCPQLFNIALHLQSSVAER